ncbi:MAG: hypothetical protein ABJO02_08530 [Reichenbachiella sp.]|uniref:hypothetical protein n=1 Tax=Reichenbachiella sp. TaxID=2184521 RepID=UPI0032974DFB
MTDVVNSSGETWWQDKTNHRVWIKLRGGKWEGNQYDTGWERTTNETMQLLIRPEN